MSDEADIASNAEELFRSAKLAHIRVLACIKPSQSRVCLNCGAKTRKGARFCDVDCHIQTGIARKCRWPLNHSPALTQHGGSHTTNPMKLCNRLHIGNH